MAAKYLHSLADENPDLKKQLGCVAGVFQVFNRHHIVSGRRLVGHKPKTLRPGSLLSNNGTPERDSSYIFPKAPSVEKHRVSTESFKDSFTSCSPSPFSYVDYNIERRPHLEPDDLSAYHQNLDLRDVVKDSMHREARGLSHKNKMKKESPDNMMDYRESHNALVELGEANWYCDEPRDLWRSKSCHMKDGFPFSLSKEYPRFSFDGRETDRLCIKSVDTSRTTPNQLKDLPRLSLDSKERSIRTLASVSLVPIKPFDSKNPEINSGISVDKGPILTRPPNLVAKLMGLETIADSPSTSHESRSHLGEDIDLPSKSPKAADFCGTIKITSSPRSLSRELTSPCWKNPETKLISRVPIEPAPWKNRDGAKTPRVTKLTSEKHSPVSSVYGEVDEKLKNLEFSQSGKDLRALKQILAAMQAVEARKGQKQEKVESFRNHELSLNDHRNPTSPSSRSDVSTAHESHIVIMKPAKVVGKRFANHKTGNDSITEVTLKERRSRMPTPPTDRTKPKKQSESRHSNRRQRQPSYIEQGDDQGTEVESRKFSQQVNSKKLSKTDTDINAPEYPSPVSVLDDSVYTDNSPSPVKRTPKDDSTSTQTLAEIVVTDEHDGTKNVIQSTINREKLKKVEVLVQKLKGFNSSHDETHTDYIASLCENMNPDNRYISEIFLASGLLLQDLESFEFHSSGHPINPELFVVLEHTKFSNLKNEKFHRKLIFDSVNEILVGKLSSGCRTLQNPRKLLRESCIEIENRMMKKAVRCGLGDEDEDDDLKIILREDVMSPSENWMCFHGENPAIVVEVERLVFRDLIDELVMFEVNDCI